MVLHLLTDPACVQWWISDNGQEGISVHLSGHRDANKGSAQHSGGACQRILPINTTLVKSSANWADHLTRVLQQWLNNTEGSRAYIASAHHSH